jgi:hypothetical protein
VSKHPAICKNTSHFPENFTASCRTLDLEGLSGGLFTIKLVSMTSSTTPGLLPDFSPATNYLWTVAAADVHITANMASSNQLVIDATAFANPHAGAFGAAIVGNTLAVSYTPAVALAPPTISGVMMLTNGSFELTFNGPAGQTFRVISTNVLGAPLGSWPVLTNGTFGTASVNFINPGATTNNERFYGIVSP